MFWTDWGSTPKIERASLSGTNRILLINLTSSVQNWPNAIILDYLEDRIYWINAWMNAINSADLDGNNRRIIASQLHPSQNMLPFDFTVYNGVLYWSDWNTDSIERLNWTTAAYLGGFGILTSDRVFGLALLHPSRQPASAGNYSSLRFSKTGVSRPSHKIYLSCLIPFICQVTSYAKWTMVAAVTYAFWRLMDFSVLVLMACLWN